MKYVDSVTEGDSYGPCTAKGEKRESLKCSAKLKKRNKVTSKECITKTPGPGEGGTHLLCINPAAQ